MCSQKVDTEATTELNTLSHYTVYYIKHEEAHHLKPPTQLSGFKHRELTHRNSPRAGDKKKFQWLYGILQAEPLHELGLFKKQLTNTGFTTDRK